ncbi:TRAFAC clade GTPase domain-containing protein [Actinophytocola sp.]|uniref:TRAFAC clade GTPase domain-containing protein n=1 Tax=Actinophytocola sp. TaxID=1872138 RepID=UPI002ED16148
MGEPVMPAPRTVRCPICADPFAWPEGPEILIKDEDTGQYKPKDISPLSPEKQAFLLRQGYLECPNPSGDTPSHLLPATYVNYQDPLVIGLVGAPASGKTHLLTAMIRQAYRNGLDPYDISTTALDILRHDDFRSRYIEMFEKGAALPGTTVGVIEAADILLLRGPTGERPVTFFDVAGEDLASTAAENRSNRFLLGANAVIFVCEAEDPLETKRLTPAENKAFELAVERLRSVPGRVDQLPATIAVTKSDRLRYVPPADRWLRRGDERFVDPRRVQRESRDVFAYLSQTGAAASLLPFETFRRCTLHFVSASGGDAVPVNGQDGGSTGDGLEKYFPRGIRPTRVLEPLVAILAMTGVIPGAEADRVGRP